MIEILHFVFSSFWVWLGTVILLAIPATALSNAIVSLIGVLRR